MLFSALNYEEIRQKASESVIVLPLGATEQHGPHLAVSTDTDIVSKIAQEAEKQLPGDILLCPELPYGSSNHHLFFGGTISLSAETYSKLVIELVGSIIRSGFRRIVLLNGHGGNITPVKQALAVLSGMFDVSANPNIALVTYWELAGKIFAGESPMESPALSHACEYETSLMLHLFPGKVWTDKAVRARRPMKNGYIPWEDDEPYRGVTMIRQTQFISGNGSSGEPQLASASKGAHLFGRSVESLVRFINEFKTWPFQENLSE